MRVKSFGIGMALWTGVQFVMSRLVKLENQIMRILSQRDNQVFVIDCIKKTMPKWISIEELMGFVYTDFAKENQYVQYTVDGENYLYQIFAVYFEEDYRLDLYRDEDYSEEEVKTFINRSLEKSIYKYDIEVKDTDKIITLITCTRMYGVDDKKQFVVVGKMVDNNTPTASYKVEETSHYEQIKKLMEGVDENVEA